MNAVPSYVPVEPSRHGRKAVQIAVVILAILFLCAVAGAALFASVVNEKGPVEASIDAFMQALSRDDFEGAYGQLSGRAKQSVNVAEFENYFSQRANKVLTAGYEAAEIESINMSWKADADATEPQGQVAEVSGSLSYEGGYAGAFAAILEREGDAWRIYGINLTVPPQKMEDYLKGVAE